MTDHEKGDVHARADSAPTNSDRHSKASSMHIIPADLEEYFRGPIDIDKHSKWPFFLRVHGSILPKMIVPLLFVGAWATAITCISQLVHPLEIESTLLTVTGFVVGLALSFRSSTAYERYTEGRKYWSQLLLNSRNMARMIWVHVKERHGEESDLGKQDLLAKLAALNLLNAFAVSLKHRLRFEPSVEYPDLQPLIGHLHTFAGSADQAPLRETKVSSWKHTGQSLGLSFAESNPRKLVKRSKENLGNTPLEVLTYLGAYLENTFQNATLAIPAHQTQVMNYLIALTDVLTGVERVVNTPLPVAYSISISQITWAYVVVLPFQLIKSLDWVAIPGTILAGYIILGIAQIGRELENPFGQDPNDLPLDAFCRELANDIDSLTAHPAPMNNEEWMRDGSAKLLWPYSGLEYRAWEAKSVDEIREALRGKAQSKETKIKRMETMILSGEMTTGAREDGAA